MPTKDDLKLLQALPLEIKVLKTQQRIREWVQRFGVDGVYISFSGGKDSTVLLHIARQIYPEIEAVFVDTGLEYPEIRSFVRQHDNVTVIRPMKSFRQVIREYGYPVISKEVSNVIASARRDLENGKCSFRVKRLNGEALNKNGKKSIYNCEKYKPIICTDFLVSDKCCDIMKKRPLKRMKKCGITAQMACESRLRTQKWLENGCNAFTSKNPISNPMSFWTEQDILHYIRENDLPIASVYGEITPVDGQLAFFDEDCKLCTTGCNRTGCMFCGFGAHLDKGETRFQRMKRTHPKQYEYCIGGGVYDPEDGFWKPDKNGLGMAHVFDELNKLYGEDFIRYK